MIAGTLEFRLRSIQFLTSITCRLCDGARLAKLSGYLFVASLFVTGSGYSQVSDGPLSISVERKRGKGQSVSVTLRNRSRKLITIYAPTMYVCLAVRFYDAKFVEVVGRKQIFDPPGPNSEGLFDLRPAGSFQFNIDLDFEMDNLRDSRKVKYFAIEYNTKAWVSKALKRPDIGYRVLSKKLPIAAHSG